MVPSPSLSYCAKSWPAASKEVIASRIRASRPAVVCSTAERG
jgi:hypothetical protein